MLTKVLRRGILQRAQRQAERHLAPFPPLSLALRECLVGRECALLPVRTHLPALGCTRTPHQFTNALDIDISASQGMARRIMEIKAVLPSAANTTTERVQGAPACMAARTYPQFQFRVLKTANLHYLHIQLVHFEDAELTGVLDEVSRCARTSAALSTPSPA